MLIQERRKKIMQKRNKFQFKSFIWYWYFYWYWLKLKATEKPDKYQNGERTEKLRNIKDGAIPMFESPKETCKKAEYWEIYGRNKSILMHKEDRIRSEQNYLNLITIEISQMKLEWKLSYHNTRDSSEFYPEARILCLYLKKKKKLKKNYLAFPYLSFSLSFPILPYLSFLYLSFSYLFFQLFLFHSCNFFTCTLLKCFSNSIFSSRHFPTCLSSILYQTKLSLVNIYMNMALSLIRVKLWKTQLIHL